MYPLLIFKQCLNEQGADTEQAWTMILGPENFAESLAWIKPLLEDQLYAIFTLECLYL